MAIAGHVVFSHGLDGTPFSTKIRALYEIAEAEGFDVAAVDYRGVTDAEERVQMLHEFCRDFTGHLVLAGSSLGGYVSLAAAPTLHAKGVFLMAPAIHMPGIPPLRRGLPTCPIALVHGWRDDVIPYEQSMRFAKENRLSLHMVESDHRLHSAIPFLRYLFQYFLIESRRAQYVP
ncbi:MAG: alpha/beta fold hydrolase [Steroidobacteraceae bacterium]